MATAVDLQRIVDEATERVLEVSKYPELRITTRLAVADAIDDVVEKAYLLGAEDRLASSP